MPIGRLSAAAPRFSAAVAAVKGSGQLNLVMRVVVQISNMMNRDDPIFFSQMSALPKKIASSNNFRVNEKILR